MIKESRMVKGSVKKPLNTVLKESSIDLIYDMILEQHKKISSWSDSLDNKIIGLFSLTVVIVGTITALNSGQLTADWHVVPLVISVFSFIVSSLLCLKAYQTKKFSLGLDTKILFEDYVKHPPSVTKYLLIKHDTKHSNKDIKTINDKANLLNLAILAGAFEIVSLIIWIIIT